MRQKKEVNTQIGEQVRLARDRAKLTQEQLAERINVSSQYISDLERGIVGISIPTLKRACIALGTTSDSILFGSFLESRCDAIECRCKNLTDADFSVLLEVVDLFVGAFERAHLIE